MQRSITTSKPGLRRPPRGVFVHHAFLHPDRLRAHADGRFHDLGNKFGAPENIHDIDRLRNLIQIRIALLAQHFGLIRIHRNDPVARALHVFRHAVARPEALARKPHHRDDARRLQDLRDPSHAVVRSRFCCIARFSFFTSSSSDGGTAQA